MSGLLDIETEHNEQARVKRALYRGLYGFERPQVADFSSGWLNQSTALAVDTDLGIYIDDDYSSPNNVARSLLMPMPTPPFTAEVIFDARALPNVNWRAFGLQMRDSAAGTGVVVASYYNAAQVISSQRWSAENTYNASSHFFADTNIPHGFNGLRIYDDGTDHQCYFSPDWGDSWWAIGSAVSRTAYLASPDRVGLFLNMVTQSARTRRGGVQVLSFRTF